MGGRVARRRFLKRAIGAGAAVWAAPTLLAALPAAVRRPSACRARGVLVRSDALVAPSDVDPHEFAVVAGLRYQAVVGLVGGGRGRLPASVFVRFGPQARTLSIDPT